MKCIFQGWCWLRCCFWIYIGVPRCNPTFALRMKRVPFSEFVFPLAWHRRKALSKYYCKARVVQPNPSIICYNFSAGITVSSLWGMLTHPGQFITRQGLEQAADATWIVLPRDASQAGLFATRERTASKAANRALEAGGGKDGRGCEAGFQAVGPSSLDPGELNFQAAAKDPLRAMLGHSCIPLGNRKRRAVTSKQKRQPGY